MKNEWLLSIFFYPNKNAINFVMLPWRISWSIGIISWASIFWIELTRNFVEVQIYLLIKIAHICYLTWEKNSINFPFVFKNQGNERQDIYIQLVICWSGSLIWRHKSPMSMYSYLALRKFLHYRHWAASINITAAFDFLLTTSCFSISIVS